MDRRWIGRGAGLIAAFVALFAALCAGNLWWIGRAGLYTGEWIEVEARPEDGFEWPFRLYVPEMPPGEAVRLWVRPNNTGAGVSDDFWVHHEDAAHLLATSRWQAEQLEVAALVPSFPRPDAQWETYTHALDRDTILADPPLERLDLQLLAMADHAATLLADRGVCAEVFVDGFSASGMFANRFALIHPERVAAVAVGAPGGWPMVPVPEVDGTPLPYPAGTADYEALFGRPPPRAAWRATPMLFYLGDRDTNDSVPYTDGYEEPLAEAIIAHFGEGPVDRWDDAERLYSGLDATFRLDRGVGHEAPRASIDAVLDFFAAHDDRSSCL